MHKINCTVTDCSFNNESICCADRINIGGVEATNEDHTCCGTFLDKAHYSDLTNKANSNSTLTAIVCKVNTCKHNNSCDCELNSINVSGLNETKIYTETNCCSFEIE